MQDHLGWFWLKSLGLCLKYEMIQEPRDPPLGLKMESILIADIPGGLGMWHTVTDTGFCFSCCKRGFRELWKPKQDLWNFNITCTHLPAMLSTALWKPAPSPTCIFKAMRITRAEQKQSYDALSLPRAHWGSKLWYRKQAFSYSKFFIYVENESKVNDFSPILHKWGNHTLACSGPEMEWEDDTKLGEASQILLAVTVYCDSAYKPSLSAKLLMSFMRHKQWGWLWATGPVVLAPSPLLAPQCGCKGRTRTVTLLSRVSQGHGWGDGTLENCCCTSPLEHSLGWWLIPGMEFLGQLVRMEMLAVSNSPVSTGLEDGRSLIETELFSSSPRAASFQFPAAFLEEQEKERSQICGKSW